MRKMSLALGGLVLFTCSQTVVAGTCLYDDKVDYEPYFEYDTCWERDWWPVGNGRIGAMVVGGSRAAGDQRCWRLMFNCDSMWSGIRDALPAGDRKSGGQVNFGRFLDMGELYVYFDGVGDFGRMSRRLDLMTGVITAEGEDGEGRKVRLETFASRPDDVIVIHGEFSKPASGRIVLTGRHAEVPRCTDGNAVAYDWTLPNGLAYAARVDAWADGGKVFACGTSYLDFENVASLIVVLRARTSADMRKIDFGLDFKRIPYGPLAACPDYAALKARHVADFSAAMRRVELEIDGTPDEVKKLPTRMRVERCRKGKSDPDLVATLFQYGRYLLFSCSRTGGFPANLQGLWTNNSWPAWRSDYHLDINLQMNYWGADVANLSEAFEPLADWLQAIQTFAERETRRLYPASRGFSLPVVSNLAGTMMRCNHSSSALWLAAELFDHYLYTQDRSYLEKIAWPFLKGATAFGLSRLKEQPDGSLVVPDGWSPEHGPHEDGVAYDHQLLRECLKAVARAQAVLKDDPGFAAECADAARRLTGDRIGRWGQLQEWSVDRDVKGDEHRHASHLFAVYPGTTISRGEKPELAKAAAVALDGRLLTGDARRSWTWPWRAALWARLGDGERAGEMVESILRYNALPNLLTTHPPFQIDGNLGIVGAIAEMLVQSHEIGTDGKPQVRLLPAVPACWPSGSVKGLRTRGGGTVSFAWENGKVRSEDLAPQNLRMTEVDQIELGGIK